MCTYSSDKEHAISIERIKMPFTTGSPKGMFRRDTSHFTWLLDNLLPSKLRLPPAKVGKVVSSHPPLSLPCCGWKAAVTIPDPSLVLGQGQLQALLLQESSQGDPGHFKRSVGGTGVAKEVKDAVLNSVFRSC